MLSYQKLIVCLYKIEAIIVKYENIVDIHTHSIHSFDGNDPVEELCQSAIEKGAKVIAITDHCDIDGADMDPDELCPAQLKDINYCINKYSDKIEILKGIEIGQGIYRKKETQALLNKYDYDFVLGSLHNLENMEDFFFLDYKNYDIDELLTRYFDGLLELCKWGAFDSLAHLTYPLRYIVAREKIDVDMNKYSDVCDAIFEELIKSDKALEINTSGLFMDMKDTLPNISFVKRYKQLGGEYITLGSDSHYANRVCQGIEQGLDIARAAGFDFVTVFEKRQPRLIEIK